MGRSWLAKKLHPSHLKREEKQKAADARAAAEQQAAEAREAERIRKEQELAHIAARERQLKADIEAWYLAELTKAKESYIQNHQEYTTAINNLDVAFANKKQEIDNQIKSQEEKLLAGKQEDLAELESYKSSLIDLAREAKEQLEPEQAACMPEMAEIVEKINESMQEALNDIQARYAEQLLELKKEAQQLHDEATNSYKVAKQEIEAKWSQYLKDYNAHIADLDAVKAAKLKAVESHIKQEMANIETEYKARVAAIDVALRKRIQEIDDRLAQELKRLNSSTVSSLISAGIVIAGCIVVYFMPELAPFIGGTVAGAADNLINDKDEINIGISTNIMPPSKERYNTSTPPKFDTQPAAYKNKPEFVSPVPITEGETNSSNTKNAKVNINSVPASKQAEQFKPSNKAANINFTKPDKGRVPILSTEAGKHTNGNNLGGKGNSVLFAQETEYWERPNGPAERKAFVDLMNKVDDKVFAPIRATKDSVTGYFERSNTTYMKHCERLGVRPDFTRPSFAAPMLSKLAMSPIPDSVGEAAIGTAAAALTKPVLFAGKQAFKTGAKLFTKGEVAGAAVEVAAHGGGNAIIKQVNSIEIRFSQSTVSAKKVRYDDITGNKFIYTFDEIVNSMKTNGWQGEPINVVKMPDGSLTAIDNTRLLAARKAGIDAKVKIHDYDAAIPKADARNYTAEGKLEPKTWGEAISTRISVQHDKYFQDRIFAEKFPNGSSYDPKLISRRPK